MAKVNKGGRPAGNKTRCSGEWTEARYRTFVKGNLRQATRKWKPIQDCLRNARVRRGWYICAGCGGEVPATIVVGRKRVKNILVDHIKPIIPVEGWVSWDDCIENMFSELDNLQALCHECHVGGKCSEEAAERAYYKARAKEYPREYNTWHSMKQRCNNPNNTNYTHYGERGVTYCDLWESFEGFMDDMGERPEGHTLERVDVNGHYCIENCTWLPAIEQPNNTRSNVRITIDGDTKNMMQWCNIFDVKHSTAKARKLRGLDGMDLFSKEDGRGKAKRKAKERLDE